jgi:phosphoribosylformylglycinamidine cyclo-ligase
MGRYDSVGVDLVNHCVNDILTSGAEPLFFLDYLAGSDLTEEQKLAAVSGIAAACRDAGCALIGGETADMPDVYAPGAFDLAGFIVGVVERDRIIDGSRIEAGDILLGLASSGLHTNGYSLVRKVFDVGRGGDPDAERAALYRTYPELGLTLGEALLVPHRCYFREVKPLLPHLKGIAHITGGGLIDNVPRVLPEGLAARFNRGSWRVPPIFTLIQRQGKVSEEEMYRVFNMGLGLVLVCAPAAVDAVKSLLPEVMTVGQVAPQTGQDRVIFL